MALLDVTVNIKLAEIVGKGGTWFPCLYFIDSTLEADTYDEYEKISDLSDTTSTATTYDATSAVYKMASKLFMQEGAPKKIGVLAQKAFSSATMATYLTKGWRQLVLVGDVDTASEIAEYIETTDKMVFINQDDESELATLYDTVKDFDRTFIVYHTDPTAVGAVVGATSGLKAGSFTYKNIRIKGIEPTEVSASQLKAIHAKGAITIVEKVGDTVTSEGIVASGEYADIIDSKDFIIQNISYNTQKVYNNNPKVPYTNNGIAMLEIATVEALKDGYNNGMIADKEDGTPDYSTTFALRSETTEADRAKRVYPYGKFSFALSGAIHENTVNGTVTV